MSALPSINIGLTPQAEALLARIRQLPQRALRGIARGLDQANQITIGVIQKEFLSYPKNGPTTPEGLRVITNRLRGSIRASKAVISGDTVQASIGSNVKYAAVHEFGFNGTVMVGGHVRKRRVLKEFLTKTGKTTQRKVRVGDSIVAPHQRKMNLPARAPVRRGIIRNMDATKEIVSAAVIKELSA